MASVTFLSSVGGDNSTVTDDSNGTTGLANGGHRLRFVPALAQIVAVASFIVTQATNAAASASSASSSASSASTSASNASTSFINFDKKYLGAKSGDPTLDNQGAALTTGALYWNTATAKQRSYTGSTWVDVVASSGAFAANNFIVNDPTDSTKKVNFNVASVPTATTVTLTIPSASGTILTSASGVAPLANPTFTGTDVTLGNATRNTVTFNSAGGGPPTFTTRSAGTKLNLWSGLSGSAVDFALGIDGFTLWTSVPTSAYLFGWYAGTTKVADMNGVGAFSANSFTAPSTDIGASALPELQLS